jgi:hypothetical protein
LWSQEAPSEAHGPRAGHQPQGRGHPRRRVFVAQVRAEANQGLPLPAVSHPIPSSSCSFIRSFNRHINKQQPADYCSIFSDDGQGLLQVQHRARVPGAQARGARPRGPVDADRQLRGRAPPLPRRRRRATAARQSSPTIKLNRR